MLAQNEDWESLRKELPAAALQTDSGSAERLHRLLAKLATATSLPVLRLSGQCTLDLLAPKLSWQGLRRGRLWKVECAPFDSVLPDLTRSHPDLLILVPWSARFLTHRDPDAELVLWRTAWRSLSERGIRFVQASYDWVSAGPLGHYGSRHDGEVAAITDLNARLRDELPSEAFYFDLGLPAGELGRRHFYDARNYYWFKQPFSEQGLDLLAAHLAAVSDALLGGARKVVVTDLDNTLWGGEVGELGALGVGLGGPDGEAFLDFQRYLKSLKERGVLLAVNSKNSEENARAVFRENSQMLLREDDFAAFFANWSPKPENLRSVAAQLNLSLESLVFVDDNLRECEQVARTMPEVKVVHLDGGPSNFRRQLEEGMHFETLGLSDEDIRRTELYQSSEAREKARKETVDHDAYLRFLEMRASIADIGPDSMLRAVQLLGKTNQFNLTTRRHGAEKLQAFGEIPGAYLRTLSLSDRFGDLGMVGVLLAVPDAEQTLTIDSWVLSCRVFERTVEHRFFSDLVDFARKSGVRRLRGHYLPTSKNAYVAALLPSLGFEESGGEYVLHLDACREPLTWVS